MALLGISAALVFAEPEGIVERRVTTAAQNHVLTNSSIWSPDSEWIVYDTRSTPEKFEGTKIEAVNIKTGDIKLLYESKNGSNCGVATWHPEEPKVVFILGPENPTADWSYGFTRRRGVIVDARRPGETVSLDAMDYAPPFTPGALRGGSHVHIFSPDGKCVSFTYEDEVLARLGEGDSHDLNQRNIGVSVLGQAVHIPRHHPRNNDGNSFTTIVTRTVSHPKPGSDQISRACEEAWIGDDGYLRADGSRQQRALAFQGQVTAANGGKHYEVFVVDLPEDLTKAGPAPLEGTSTTYPAPPAGTTQRRLTFTDSRKFPGIQGPRHWLKSSPDGSQIAFLMKDDAGIVQIWTISPLGGNPRQLTKNPWDVSSAFSWSPDGKSIACVMDGSVFVTDTETGQSRRLTAKSDAILEPYACVISPDGKNIAYARKENGFDQIYILSIPST